MMYEAALLLVCLVCAPAALLPLPLPAAAAGGGGEGAPSSSSAICEFVSVACASKGD
jgi:hypothetical protein